MPRIFNLRRATPALILFICLLPIIFSCHFYFIAQPQKSISYGQLLVTKSIITSPIYSIDGQALAKNKWWLLIMANGECDVRCQDRLFAIRQYRSGQGKEADRIIKVWAVDNRASVNTTIPGYLLHNVSIIDGRQLTLDKSDLWPVSIFLIDPKGNQVMRYTQGQDHRKIMHEISQLLKHNQGLG